MTTVKEIVIASLKEMGADGLCDKFGDCGCGLDDLFPCIYTHGGNNIIRCAPAKKMTDPPGGGTWYVQMTDEEIAANLDKKLCHDMGGCHRQQGSEGPRPDRHVHSFDIPESHSMGGDEDEPQEPPEVRA